MKEVILKMSKQDFLISQNIEETETFIIKTPCRIVIESDIVADLNANYSKNEEIGGVLWGKTMVVNEERVIKIAKVSYIRNAIEDTKREDRKNKSDAYLADRKELSQCLTEIFSQGLLPFSFHTHPIDNSFEKNFQTETSKQDQYVATIPYNINNMKLLIPQILIIGSNIPDKDIFIGVYGGFITPDEFSGSKRKVQEMKIQEIKDTVSSVKFSDNQKLGLFLGAILILVLLFKYPKFSIPVILTLGTLVLAHTTNTENIENPLYFNKLSSGQVNILIP